MGQEIEAKFYLQDLPKIAAHLQALGARLIQPRTHELNLRFDTPDGDFQRQRRVLRLRQDEGARLTYKDGATLEDGAFSRREIEFVVGNFDSAREFIEALGYEVAFTYEKYRTTYIWGLAALDALKDRAAPGPHLMLDELPYGDFVEIEGELEQLKPVAIQLGLKWEAAIPASYHELFERLRAARKLTFRDLTYANFKDLEVSASDMGVFSADA
jgi:adenylate cyclase, class 2